MNYKNYIEVNLQLFANSDKTEKATPKKKQDARKKGQVFQSKEISSAFVLLFIFIGLKLFGGFMTDEIKVFTKSMFSNFNNIESVYSINGLTQLVIRTMVLIFKVMGPIMAIALVTALAVEYAQVGVLFTTETLKFKLERLSPISGLKRIFSLRAVVELVKSIVKLVFVGYVAYSFIKGQSDNVLNIMNMDAIGISTYIASTSLDLAIRICIVMVFIGAVDYIYQWYDYEKNLRMTKQEIKEEYKQVEGNPEIKSKIKQKQREMSMRRMLQDVPKADVVITNPTHFAVAIKYDDKVSSAPIVIAKGQDFLAQRIKETARENKVEIVENKPLARALYDAVNIGQEIPQELYQAVAEVLAFVYSLKQKR
jgi:flagellar biosynthetic protein FlhB